MYRLHQCTRLMEDSGLFGDIEQDNNPLFYNTSASDTLTETQPEPKGKKEPRFEPHYNNDLVNSSIGLSQRIRKMLNNPKLLVDVVLTERLMNSSVIVYLIELRLESKDDAIIVKRRYSEFKSLRDNLVKLFPTTIVPPIPEKHTLFTYLVNSIDNTKELSVIEVRKRYFRNFLRDVVFDSNTALRNCPLLHKFLDPSYEMCWDNAINEPPVLLLPQNLLLANPNDPTDQNGLYLLLPSVNGFEVDSTDNLSALKKINTDLHKLRDEISIYDLKENNRQEVQANPDIFGDIPADLVTFEINFHQNIKVLQDVHKLNTRSARNLRQMINILIELGGNLNNFSLQIHETNSSDDNQLSLTIEKFGSTMDSSFLNFEHFLYNHVIPDWQEPVTQFIQYYYSALQLIKFYKYKLIQYKLLYKLKFNKVQELSNFNNSFQSVKHLKNLNINSPSISKAIQKIESKQRRGGSLQSKKLWYGLFGGNKASFSLPDEAFRQIETPDISDINTQYQHKIQHIEKELNKIDQLIALVNGNMVTLTQNLKTNFEEFMVKMEKRWLLVMLDYIRAGKQLFRENEATWQDLKGYVQSEQAPT